MDQCRGEAVTGVKRVSYAFSIQCPFLMEAHISWLVSYNMEYIPNDETFYIVFTYATVRGEHYTFTLNIFTYCDCSSMEKNNE